MIVDNEITRSDFEKSLKLQGLESFNSDQVSAWLNDNKKLIEKSKVEELDELEKSALDEFKVNAGSLKKVIVVEDNLEKSIVFVRPQQVDWDKDENGEILKSRAGTYKDTPENRKLGRVGQKFGGKKESEGKESDSKEPKPKSSSNEDMAQYHREMMDYHNKKGEGHLYHRHMAKRDEYKQKMESEKSGDKKKETKDVNNKSRKEIFNELKKNNKELFSNTLESVKKDDKAVYKITHIESGESRNFSPYFNGKDNATPWDEAAQQTIAGAIAFPELGFKVEKEKPKTHWMEEYGLLMPDDAKLRYEK